MTPKLYLIIYGWLGVTGSFVTAVKGNDVPSRAVGIIGIAMAAYAVYCAVGL